MIKTELILKAYRQMTLSDEREISKKTLGTYGLM